jgi:hypothetical protein
VTAIEDIFADRAENVSDVEWVRWANEHADAMLTKDKRMRYQEAFQTALCPVFALTDGNIALAEVVRRIDQHRLLIWRRARSRETQYWAIGIRTCERRV